MEASSAVCTWSTASFIFLASFGVGAFLTLPRAKPDDTTARDGLSRLPEMRRRWIVRDGVAPANCESFLHLIFDRIGSGREGFARAGSDTGIPYAFTGQLEGSSGASVIRHSMVTATRARRCRKINSGRRLPSRRAIACAKLHRDGLVAVKSAVTSRLPNLAWRALAERYRRQPCVPAASLSAAPIGAQLNQPACRRSYDHACGACCLGWNWIRGHSGRAGPGPGCGIDEPSPARSS